MKIENRKKLKRYHIPYHARGLTFSCYRKFHFFNDPIACMIFLDFLSDSRRCFNFKLWSYILMPDHVHLLIWFSEEGDLVTKVTHYVKGKTGREYKNHIIDNVPETFHEYCCLKRGMMKFQFWQPGGGYDRNLWSTKAIHAAINYIEYNPVKAGLVSKPAQWRWSSAWARKNKSGLIPDDVNIPMMM